MTPEQENFDALRRLLKLKRYEQPPPRYFNDFSSQVIAQIKSGAQGKEDVLDRLSWEVPWLQRLLEAFQAKPALAVGFGAAVCAVLVGGVIYSESMEYKPMPLMPRAEDLAKVVPAPAPAPNVVLGASVPSALAIGTNNSPSGSLFDQFRPEPPELIKFTGAGTSN